MADGSSPPVCAICGAVLPRLSNGQRYWLALDGRKVHPQGCPEGMRVPVTSDEE
jgi:hypothetical protein